MRNRKNFIALIAVITAFAAMLCGCSEINEKAVTESTSASQAESASTPYPITIEGVEFSEAPSKVASLSPAITEIIAELGFSANLAGRGHYCDYPSEITAVTDIGSAANPDITALTALNPELVITQSPIAKKDVISLNNSGIKVLIIKAPESLDELEKIYRDIYEIFSGSDGGEDERISAIFTPIREALANAGGSVGSFVYILSAKLAFAPSNSFSGNILSFYGQNSAADCTGISITTDKLLELNPKYLFLAAPLTAEKLPDELSELDAVKNNRVIIISSDMFELFDRPTSRVLTAINELDKLIADGQKQ